MNDDIAARVAELERKSVPACFTQAPIQPPPLTQLSKELAARDESKRRAWAEHVRRLADQQAAENRRLAPKRAKRDAELKAFDDELAEIDRHRQKVWAAKQQLAAKPL